MSIVDDSSDATAEIADVGGSDIIDDGSSAFPHNDGDVVLSSSSWLSWIMSWITDQSSRLILLDANVWMGRILATIVIVFLWDTFLQPKQQQQHEKQQELQQEQSRPASRNHHHQNKPSDLDHSKCNDNGVDKDDGDDDDSNDNDDDDDNDDNDNDNTYDDSGNGRELRSQNPSTKNDSSCHSDDENKNENETIVVASSSSSSSQPQQEQQEQQAAILQASSLKSSSKSSSKLNKSSMIPVVAPPPSPRTTTATATLPKIKATSNQHPGMEAFAHWYEVETSLYRIYTLTRRDGTEVFPPYVPHSYRGTVSIELHVTNNTNRNINVFWVDYKGNHIPKGTIPRNHGVWTQTTWIDHPWVFEDANNSTPYLYYVPYRAIPTLPTASTIGPDGTIGLHKFTLVNKNNTGDDGGGDDPFHIGIRDDIMPFPAITQLHQPLHAINWTLKHMSRANSTGNMAYTITSEVDTLQKYLMNIMNHPDRVKYRQLRIGASSRFQSIWASPLRGLLLAVGFVEVGPYTELGCHDQALSPERVQDVALLSYLLNEWKRKENGAMQQQQQPPGAVDGFGRAGFGRAGTIN